MIANKTTPTKDSVSSFLGTIIDTNKREDAIKLSRLMEVATGARPVMWGTSIIGFGNNHYVYETGREGDTPAVSFAVRKNALTLYGVMFFVQNEKNVELAQQLGPHTHGKGCLYIKRLDDINLDILKKMIIIAYKARSS